MQTLVHPLSGATILGVRLPPGTTINEGDYYDSSDGTWRTAPIIAGGSVPRGNHVIWVRQPTGPLSDNARILLGYLARRPQCCIGERDRSFYVIPSPNFNWDGRFDIPEVQHPECVQELFDHGFLTSAKHTAANWMSDYSTIWVGHKNTVYTLTEDGRQKGNEIIGR
jgi:hypothetical protein